MRVAVLMGGSSEERGVSLASGCEVAAALRSAGHRVDGVDSARGLVSRAQEERILAAGIARTDAPPLGESAVSGSAGAGGLPDARVLASEPALRQADVVFLALHGGAGEDGTVQTLLETTGVPYAGSGPVGCALAMDKDLAKRLMRDAKIPTPDWVVVQPARADPATRADPANCADAAARLGLPLVVKPVSGGSSVRLTLVRSEAERAEAQARAAGGGDAVMCEAYVQGREFTVGVLDGKALPVVQIEPSRELFDFDCKYEDGMAREIAPAPIPQELATRLQTTAVRVGRLLRLRHFSRVDFIVDRRGTAWCLEANALPGLTRNSLLPKAAAAAGIPFPQLCERICRLGARKTTQP